MYCEKNHDIEHEMELETKNSEKHIPGYNFCGPGTHVTTRLCKFNHKGINDLDEACRRHDVEYMEGSGLPDKIRASDNKLLETIEKKNIKGLAASLVKKTFRIKKNLENLGLMSRTKFSECSGITDCNRKRRVGKYLLNKFFNKNNN